MARRNHSDVGVEMGATNGRRARLAVRVILITGASRGIGLAAAAACRDEGAHVVLTDIRDTLGESETRRLGESGTGDGGGRIEYRHLDVRQEGDWETAIGTVLERFGRLDVLVNNAGVYQFAPLGEITEEQFHRQFGTNVLG